MEKIPCEEYTESVIADGVYVKDEIKIIPINNMQNFPLYIQSAGITRPEPRYKITRMQASHIVLEYVRSGKGYIEHKGKTYEVGPGDIYVLQPTGQHRYHADPKDPFEKIWVNFTSEPVSAFITKSSLSDALVFHDTGLGGKVEELYALIKSSLYLDLTCHEILTLLLEIFIGLDKSNPPQEISALSARIWRYINAHATVPEPLIDYITQEMFISRSKVYREFRKHFSQTPKEYTLTLRIERAKAILTETEYPVYQISELVGFNDAHYFSHLFKKKTGMTPLEYRRESRALRK